MTKILIVDDNRDHAETLKALLISAGFDAQTESKPLNALKRIVEYRPELILLDIHMPEMGGLELLTKLTSNKETKDVYVIMQSATELKKDVFSRAVELGASDFIAMPAPSEEILARIKIGVFRIETRGRLQNRMQTITTSAKDAIMMIDNDGCVIFWNRSAEQIFGYTSDEMMGKNLHKILCQGVDYQKYLEKFPTFQKTGTGAAIGKTLEIEAVKKDGTVFPCELSLSAIMEDGKWCSVGTLRDITDRKKAEGELKKQVVELERFQKVTMGRERRIIELKNEIKELKAQLEGRGV
jgi:PAS domain S-box-containing protein